ncbi:MAG: LamG-like jellyroll fold domain-containing protein, partial [Verrucomicrobiota bacterium]
LRFFSEGSTTDNGPLFNMGTKNAGDDGSVDMYIRAPGNHEFSTGMPLDDSWHHLAWVEGGGSGQLFIDGVADAKTDWSVGAFAEGSLDTTSIGGIRRANPSHWFTGLVDDVSLFRKALSAEEVAALAAGTSPMDIDSGVAAQTVATAIAATALDQDGDGMLDIVEQAAGTNPLDSADYLRMTKIAPSKEAISLEWSSVPGKSYVIEFTEDLSQGWEVIGNVKGEARTTGFQDADPVRVRTRSGFYRARVQ